MPPCLFELAMLKIELASNKLWSDRPINLYDSANAKVFREFWKSKMEMEKTHVKSQSFEKNFSSAPNKEINRIYEAAPNLEITNNEEKDTNNNSSGGRSRQSSPGSIMQGISFSMAYVENEIPSNKAVDSLLFENATNEASLVKQIAGTGFRDNAAYPTEKLKGSNIQENYPSIEYNGITVSLEKDSNINKKHTVVHTNEKASPIVKRKISDQYIIDATDSDQQTSAIDEKPGQVYSFIDMTRLPPTENQPTMSKEKHCSKGKDSERSFLLIEDQTSVTNENACLVISDNQKASTDEKQSMSDVKPGKLISPVSKIVSNIEKHFMREDDQIVVRNVLFNKEEFQELKQQVIHQFRKSYKVHQRENYDAAKQKLERTISILTEKQEIDELLCENDDNKEEINVISVENLVKSVMLRQFQVLKDILEKLDGIDGWEQEFNKQVNSCYYETVDKICKLAYSHGIPVIQKLQLLRSYIASSDPADEKRYKYKSKEVMEEKLCSLVNDLVDNMNSGNSCQTSLKDDLERNSSCNSNADDHYKIEKNSTSKENVTAVERNSSYDSVAIDEDIIQIPLPTYQHENAELPIYEYNNPFDIQVVCDLLSIFSKSTTPMKQCHENVFLTLDKQNICLIEAYFAKHRMHLVELGLSPPIKHRYGVSNGHISESKCTSNGWDCSIRIPVIWGSINDETKSMICKILNTKLRCLWALDMESNETLLKDLIDGLMQNYNEEDVDDIVPLFDLAPYLESETPEPNSPSTWLSQEDLRFLHSLIESDKKLPKARNFYPAMTSVDKENKKPDKHFQEKGFTDFQTVKRRLLLDENEKINDSLLDQSDLGVTYLSPYNKDKQRCDYVHSLWNNEDLQRGFEMGADISFCENDESFPESIQLSDSLKALRKLQREFENRDLQNIKEKEESVPPSAFIPVTLLEDFTLDANNIKSIHENIDSKLLQGMYDSENNKQRNLSIYKYDSKQNWMKSGMSKSNEKFESNLPGRELMKLLNIAIPDNSVEKMITATEQNSDTVKKSQSTDIFDRNIKNITKNQVSKQPIKSETAISEPVIRQIDIENTNIAKKDQSEVRSKNTGRIQNKNNSDHLEVLDHIQSLKKDQGVIKSKSVKNTNKIATQEMINSKYIPNENGQHALNEQANASNAQVSSKQVHTGNTELVEMHQTIKKSKRTTKSQDAQKEQLDNRKACIDSMKENQFVNVPIDRENYQKGETDKSVNKPMNMEKRKKDSTSCKVETAKNLRKAQLHHEAKSGNIKNEMEENKSSNSLKKIKNVTESLTDEERKQILNIIKEVNYENKNKEQSFSLSKSSKFQNFNFAQKEINIESSQTQESQHVMKSSNIETEWPSAQNCLLETKEQNIKTSSIADKSKICKLETNLKPDLYQWKPLEQNQQKEYCNDSNETINLENPVKTSLLAASHQIQTDKAHTSSKKNKHESHKNKKKSYAQNPKVELLGNHNHSTLSEINLLSANNDENKHAPDVSCNKEIKKEMLDRALNATHSEKATKNNESMMKDMLQKRAELCPKVIPPHNVQADGDNATAVDFPLSQRDLDSSPMLKQSILPEQWNKEISVLEMKLENLSIDTTSESLNLNADTPVKTKSANLNVEAIPFFSPPKHDSVPFFASVKVPVSKESGISTYNRQTSALPVSYQKPPFFPPINVLQINQTKLNIDAIPFNSPVQTEQQEPSGMPNVHASSFVPDIDKEFNSSYQTMAGFWKQTCQKQQTIIQNSEICTISQEKVWMQKVQEMPNIKNQENQQALTNYGLNTQHQQQSVHLAVQNTTRNQEIFASEMSNIQDFQQPFAGPLPSDTENQQNSPLTNCLPDMVMQQQITKSATNYAASVKNHGKPNQNIAGYAARRESQKIQQPTTTNMLPAFQNQPQNLTALYNYLPNIQSQNSYAASVTFPNQQVSQNTQDVQSQIQQQQVASLYPVPLIPLTFPPPQVPTNNAYPVMSGGYNGGIMSTQLMPQPLQQPQQSILPFPVLQPFLSITKSHPLMQMQRYPLQMPITGFGNRL